MSPYNNILGNKAVQTALVGAVGVACWFGGVQYEKSKHLSVPRPVASAIPVAKPATAVVQTSQTPSVSESRLEAVGRRTSEIMKFGFPSLSNIRSFDDFVLSYDNRNRVANWVFEHLTEENLKVANNVDRAKCDFTVDKSIHPFFRATNEDYKKSGFDRGHLAAAGNHRLQQQHCDQTFTLSNIAPQVGVGFNRDAWNKLEKYVRKLTKKYSDVYVCTGPIYKPISEGGKRYIKYQVIGENQVAVPTHFFKVVVMVTYDDQLHMECYLMPNQAIPDSTPLTTFLVPLETIQRLSGLLFFDGPSAEKLKSINGKKSSFW
uniref:Endonuclease n=2 Tax=Lygus hesperus TaxID=30085 RepID=A0A146LNA6_LYGHE